MILGLLIAAFILFLLAGFGIPSRVNLLAFGLALWVLTHIIPLV